MQVTEKAECATVLSTDDLSKRGGAYGVKRDLRFAGWLSDRSLKVSEEILNFMRE